MIADRRIHNQIRNRGAGEGWGMTFRRRCSGFAFAALFFIAACPAARAGQDPEIVVRNPPTGWSSRASVPLYVDARARRGGEYQLTLRGEGRISYRITRTVTLAPNSTTRLELTLPTPDYASFRMEGQGWSTMENIYPGGGPSDSQPAMLCVNSFMLRELAALPASRQPAGGVFNSISMDELPGKWQSYSGLSAVIFIAADEAETLRPSQREALATWVRWLGGRVWIAGANAAAAAEAIGLGGPGGRGTPSGVPRRLNILNGRVYLQDSPDATEIAEALSENTPPNPLHSYYETHSYYDSTPGGWLVSAFGGVSSNAIIATLIALGLVLGPLNIWYIRRKGNSILFFITTPLVALVGTLSIFGASLWTEGFGGSCNRMAVLVRHGRSDEAMTFNGMAIKSGFYAPTPRFSSQALTLPFRSEGEQTDVASDFTDGVLLTGGWLKPRFASGFLVAQPVVARMGVDVVREGGGYAVVNNLGYRLKSVAAVFPDGKYGLAENVPPGGRVPLRAEARSSRLRDLLSLAQRLFDSRPAFAGVSLIAACDGLPYLDDGGMGVSLREGEYYFIQAGDDWGATQ